jgi:hypothetical protein
VIVYDRQGSGMSDPLPELVLPSEGDRNDETLAVIDAVGADQVVLVASARHFSVKGAEIRIHHATGT